MDIEVIKQTVVQLSQTFYNTQDQQQRRVAEERLNDFKKSIEAWTVTDQLLHTNTSEQVLFFAAQTIRSKIQYSFHELPPDYHEPLRNSLIEHLENLSSLNYSSVQTQIYVALSDLIMLINSWNNPVLEIIQRLNKSPEKLSCLIEFLTILPEEINNKRLKLGQNRRDQLRTTFSSSSGYIIKFLEEHLNSIIGTNPTRSMSESENCLRLVYKCFSSWIDEKLVEPNLILNSQLFVYIFNILSNPETSSNLHETVSSCLLNILLMYNFNSRVDDEHKNLLVALKDNIFNLLQPYQQAESQANTDKCCDLCLIFTELCNGLSFYLINEPNSLLGDLRCIDLLLLCGSYEDYEVFQKTFVFWFNISEEIYTNPKSEKLCLIFREYIYRLIEYICKHCQLDPTSDSIPPYKCDDFGDFRLKATDLVSDVVFIVEANKCFEKMYGILQTPNATWYQIEAALFIMCAFAKSVSQDEESSIIQVVQAILSLPEQVHVSVKSTGIKLIGELCEWLNKHPQFIENALNFVVMGFPNQHLSQVAANTMLNICTQCQQHMINHLETLINIVLSTDNIEMPCDASIELLKGVVVILCNLPSNEITSPLMQICNIQIAGLQKALSGEFTQGTKSLPLYWLDRLTAIFRTIKIRNVTNGVHPCQPVMENVWPILSVCLNKYADDFKITESCCRTLRFVLRSSEKYSNSILVDVVNVLVDKYRRNHFSCFLYLGSILVDIYGTEDEFKTGLVEMMQIFTTEAFEYIIKNCTTVENLDELRKHPDTIDDFFRLSLRFMQRCPLEFINSGIFNPIITLAVTSLNIDHRDANQSVTKFLSEFIALSHKPQIKSLAETNQSLVNRIINEIGQRMIENAINATINMTTRDTKDGIADVIIELLSANRRQVEVDLLNVLKNLRKTNINGVEIVTEQQLVDIHKKLIQSDCTADVENALIQLEQLYL